MQGLILAAGRGSRLVSSTPKCLVEVGGRPLLSHQLDALRAMGVDGVTVVVGHGEERVRAHLDDGAGVVVNDRYVETNSLYSFWLAREAVREDVLVLNCDVLFPGEVLERLLERKDSALAFDSGSGGAAEHMKVCVEDGRLVEMSKRLPSTRTSGENLGILHLTEEVARSAFGVAGALVRRGGAKDWLGAAINSLARRRPIGCVDVAGLPWVEIDFPHDLSAARRRVWPAIEALSGASGRSAPRGVRRLPAPLVAPEVSGA